MRKRSTSVPYTRWMAWTEDAGNVLVIVGLFGAVAMLGIRLGSDQWSTLHAWLAGTAGGVSIFGCILLAAVERASWRRTSIDAGRGNT